jgi:hypothetical protein
LKQPPRAPLKQPPTALEQSPSATEQQQASSLPLLRNDVVVVGLLTFALGYAVVRSFCSFISSFFFLFPFSFF